MIKGNAWLTLIISLPTSNPSARMRVWRALKSAGCGVLRDGVYLLPNSEAAAHRFEQQAAEVVAAGGIAHIVRLSSTDDVQERSFQKLFDRTDDYATLKQDIDVLIVMLATKNPATGTRTLKRLERDFALLAATDYFPGAARDQLALLLDKATHELAAANNPDEPRPAQGKIKKTKRADYQKRTWATRKHLWVDRMASAWLIRRFIDPAARFKWLNKPQDCPKTALGFDFDGATFTHVGSLVTFEVLLASFSLEQDTALARLATLVHYLDVGGIPLAEAQGVELVLKGMRERCNSDDVLLAEASRIFDDLYMTYSNEENQHEQ